MQDTVLTHADTGETTSLSNMVAIMVGRHNNIFLNKMKIYINILHSGLGHVNICSSFKFHS